VKLLLLATILVSDVIRGYHPYNENGGYSGFQAAPGLYAVTAAGCENPPALIFYHRAAEVCGDRSYSVDVITCTAAQNGCNVDDNVCSGYVRCDVSTIQVELCDANGCRKNDWNPTP
jgi:hypothetical protein